jgi:hypothetical protein
MSVFHYYILKLLTQVNSFSILMWIDGKIAGLIACKVIKKECYHASGFKENFKADDSLLF